MSDVLASVLERIGAGVYSGDEKLLAEAIERLRVEVETLREYARHAEGCSAEFGDTYRCRCGFRREVTSS